ncbi:MAG: carbamoyltransferase HypF [Chloroflexota bacterium]
MRLEVRGVVQGVGFRPFVYRLARRYDLTGWVCNTSWGVEIEVEGEAAALEALVAGLSAEAPPIARIEALTVQPIPLNHCVGFEIRDSRALAGAYQLVSPDVATCAACQGELFDPADRRYRYPFTNCTHCGPRFTIIEDIPYDRPRTTMRAFRMCPACQREYDDPMDRRFHAQPNACPACGPRLTLLDAHGQPLAEGDAALEQAAARLRAGQIVALRGLGGYQLACDATNAASVARLRERKRRPHKPLAVMVRDEAEAERHALLSDAERELLASSAAPIVLAPWRAGSSLAPVVAPSSRTVGLMLAYTPLHHLLLHDVGLPLVMTSGNLSEEPIAKDNDEAVRRLGGIADVLLAHDRAIASRYDDSVWFAPAGGPQPVRRARGVAPSPIKLPFQARPILACGPELKNTFCLTRDAYAFLSQHIGDMENLETLEHYEETMAIYRRLFHVEPEVWAHDLHPDYETTRYALAQPGAHVAVQHHHAHLAACLSDRGHDGPAIGVILDGTGYGLDGHIWGGEFLVGDGRGFARAAHLEYLPLPGGDQATHRPYRIALAYTLALAPEARFVPPLAPEAERAALGRMVAAGLNTPRTSSAGRLFDAVSALLGVCREASYEAQAAIELEQLALTWDGAGDQPYPYAWEDLPGCQSWGRSPLGLDGHRELRLAPLWAALLEDLTQGQPTAQMAWRFHATVAQLVADTCAHLRALTSLDTVALSGGCFQNRLLLGLLLPRLAGLGLRVLTHRQVPCNDGGVALGQAVIAHYRIEEV